MLSMIAVFGLVVRARDKNVAIAAGHVVSVVVSLWPKFTIARSDGLGVIFGNRVSSSAYEIV